MKLSEAILLGSMKRPKITGQLYSSEGTCALGAAFDSTNKLDEWKKLIEKYGKVCHIPMYETEMFWTGYYEDILGWETWFPAPYTGFKIHSRNKVISTIVLLNDSIGWSRESIAKWVATVEAEIENHYKVIHGHVPEYITEEDKVESKETVTV